MKNTNVTFLDLRVNEPIFTEICELITLQSFSQIRMSTKHITKICLYISIK